MQISKEDVEDFNQLYKKAFGTKLSDAEASAMANNLAELYLLLARALPSETEAREQNSDTKSQQQDDLPSPS